MKQVRETKAGKSISAWVILKAGKDIATVQAHYGNSGQVTVNVFNYGNNRSAEKGCQYGSASGYGYDKETAALSGLEIDGIVLNDHCGQNEQTEKLLRQYIAYMKREDSTKEGEEQHRRKVDKIGASFANWSTFYDGLASYNFEGDKEKAKKVSYYTSLYLKSGLDLLRALGYQVIRAI